MLAKIVLAGLAAVTTYEAIRCVLFSREWSQAALEHLRKRFGSNNSDDRDVVARYRKAAAPVWVLAAALSWCLLVTTLVRAQS